MDVNALKEALKKGEATVTFTKVNGHKRTMVCTLDPHRLPETTHDATRDQNLLVVFDTENAGWRTIKVESIISWQEGANPVAEEAPAATQPIIGWTPKVQTAG